MKKKLETILFNCQITTKIPIAPDIRAKEPTENVHLRPNHNALSYDLILRWAFFFSVLFGFGSLSKKGGNEDYALQ